MLDPNKKRIMAISLEGDAPTQAYALWDGTHLIITQVQVIKDGPENWLPALQADATKKLADRWIVMVEDRTQTFPVDCTLFNFDAINMDGRTNLQLSLDFYFSLAARGSIISDDKYKRYLFRVGGENDILVRKNDERGRLQYDVQWERFTGGHRAVLMTVAGACLEEPLSDRWMDVFRHTKPDLPEPPCIPFFKTMKKYDENRLTEVESRRLIAEAEKYVQH